MNIKKIRALLILLISFNLSAQNFSKEDFELISLMQTKFKENHVEYPRISQLVKDRLPSEFLLFLDRDKRFFTQKEVTQISQSIPSFTPLSFQKVDQFLENTYRTFADRIADTSMQLDSKSELDFFSQDSIFIHLRSVPNNFPMDKNGLSHSLTSQLKYEVLNRHSSDSSREELSPVEINHRLNETLSLVIRNYKCQISSLRQPEKLKQHILTSFLRAYAKSFDPHSDYLSAQQEGLLIASLSSEVYSAGLIFQQLHNDYVIIGINPFSDASTNDLISVGDYLLTAKEKGSGFKSLHCFSVEQLSALFFGIESDSIEVEIKSKKNQKIRRFKLAKQFVGNPSNHTFSYTLKKDNTSLGYVQFPSFYSNFDGYSRSSSNDIALILLGLKNKNHDGLIIDLRSNGGGSIKEAHDLISFFVDYGPLYTVTTESNKGGQLFKDGKRGRLLDSKLLILVNGLSASASELLAASLRPYPDVLIVGSDTYGKATGQRPIQLELQYRREPVGLALITQFKIYQLDGTSYQRVGLQPDIFIPTLFDRSFVGEQNERYVLSSPTIKKKFKPTKARNAPLVELNEQSSKRVRLDANLQKLDSMSRWLGTQIKTPYYQSLEYSSFLSSRSQALNLDFNTSTSYFEIETHEDNELYKKESAKSALRGARDPVLTEAFKIFEDWISLTK